MSNVRQANLSTLPNSRLQKAQNKGAEKEKMKREILCTGCAGKYELHPADKMMGFAMRKVTLERIQTPIGHGVTVNGNLQLMKHVKCDHCDAPISGQPGVAVTQWNTNREGTPGNWEKDFTV